MPKSPSQSQRAYLWGVAYPVLVAKTGIEAAHWNEYMLGEHGGWEVLDLFGKKRLIPKIRSSKMSAFEFAGFVDFIIGRAKLHGIDIPPPDPNLAQTTTDPATGTDR